MGGSKNYTYCTEFGVQPHAGQLFSLSLLRSYHKSVESRGLETGFITWFDRKKHSDCGLDSSTGFDTV